MYQSTRRHGGCTISMGNATQVRLNNGKSHKAQSKAQPSWWEARIWHELLQNLRTCGYMVCNPTSHCLWYPVQLGPLPSQLCHGLSTSPHQDGHVHGTSHRDSHFKRVPLLNCHVDHDRPSLVCPSPRYQEVWRQKAFFSPSHRLHPLACQSSTRE
jgi:hypothetical protein